jgi:hypothetical protein
MAAQRVTAMAFIVVLASSVGFSQVRTNVPDVVPGARPATVERITIHGTALEGNLEGDDVDRPVLVFLPPSSARERSRRYSVVYALHGYSIGAEQWSQEIHVPQTAEGAFARGAKRDDRRAARLEDGAQRIDVLEKPAKRRRDCLPISILSQHGVTEAKPRTNAQRGPRHTSNP